MMLNQVNNICESLHLDIDHIMIITMNSTPLVKLCHRKPFQQIFLHRLQICHLYAFEFCKKHNNHACDTTTLLS